MNKKCSKCKEVKPAKDFYRNRSTNDGRDCYCTECKLAHASRYKGEKRSERMRKYYIENRERIVAQTKGYRQTAKGRKTALAAAKRHKENYPERIKSRSISYNAIKNGNLKVPETCSKCPSSKEIQAHHEDYSKPLDVIWMCRTCHMEHHRLERT